MCLTVKRIYDENDISRIAFKIFRKNELGELCTPFFSEKPYKNKLVATGVPHYKISYSNDSFGTSVSVSGTHLESGAIHCFTDLKVAQRYLLYSLYCHHLSVVRSNSIEIWMVLGHSIIAEGCTTGYTDSIAFKEVELIKRIV